MSHKKSYANASLHQYLGELGSSRPSPGGGSAAALCGTLGIALLEMVSGINDKREKKVSSKPAQKLRLRLESLITLDAQVFQKMIEFFKLPKKHPKFQKALKNCSKAPLEICELALQGLKMSLLEKKRTSAWLASDLAESGILLYAAFLSGRLNVEVNLRLMSDKKFVEQNQYHLDKIQKKALIWHNEIRSVVSK